MEMEIVKWNLGQIAADGAELTGVWIGPERADKLGVDPEAIGDQEDAVLVGRSGLADENRAAETPIEGRRTDREGADLGVIRALRGRLGAEVRLLVAARALPVCRVGVDRETIRESEDGGADR